MHGKKRELCNQYAHNQDHLNLNMESNQRIQVLKINTNIAIKIKKLKLIRKSLSRIKNMMKATTRVGS